MELDLFLQEKAFKKHAKNIESIREAFINMGCEKYLWRHHQEEMSDIKNTGNLLFSYSYTVPENIKKFMNQFKNINLQSEIPFIYPQKMCKNYFIINELVKHAKSDIIIENIITDDVTENHLVIFDIDDTFNIALMHKLVYSAYFGDNFGGYKIYNEDLLYYAEFTEYNGFVATYPGHKYAHYQGCTFRRDTDPYKILTARNNIKHILDNNYFNSELYISCLILAHAPVYTFCFLKIMYLKIQGSIQITQKFVKSSCRQRAAKINHFIYRFIFIYIQRSLSNFSIMVGCKL